MVLLRALWVHSGDQAERREQRRALALTLARLAAGDLVGEGHFVERFAAALEGSNTLGVGLWLVSADHRIVAKSGSAGPAMAMPEPSTLVWPAEVWAVSDWHDRLPGFVAVRLPDDGDARYLVLQQRVARAARQWWRSLLQPIITIALIAAATLLLAAHYLRRKAAQARSVMAKLRAGELTARFAIDKDDEVGQLMLAFNDMAAEIELLVRRIQAEESSRTRLISELGHDLRTPLTAAISALETLQRHPELDASTRLRCVALACGELRYVHALIENLFLLAVTRAPDFVPRQDPLDLAQLLREEAESLAHTSTARLTLLGTESTVLLRGDATLLRRMLRNLLGNALQHAVQEVRASLAQSPGEARIEIGDDGPGFSEEALRRFAEETTDAAWEPRSRAVRDVTGHGIGSAIVRRVLALCGGALSASNRENGGALVSVRLPTAPPIA
jgi:signal transduction histidine kinase